MHPQDQNTEKDVSPETGKPQPDGRNDEVQSNAKESAQRRDRENNVGSDNEPMERRGTNMDKF